MGAGRVDDERPGPLQPDSNVLSAMNQIEAQRRMRMAAQEKAEADKILIFLQAWPEGSMILL